MQYVRSRGNDTTVQHRGKKSGETKNHNVEGGVATTPTPSIDGVCVLCIRAWQTDMIAISKNISDTSIIPVEGRMVRTGMTTHTARIAHSVCFVF